MPILRFEAAKHQHQGEDPLIPCQRKGQIVFLKENYFLPQLWAYLNSMKSEDSLDTYLCCV